MLSVFSLLCRSVVVQFYLVNVHVFFPLVFLNIYLLFLIANLTKASSATFDIFYSDWL
jgi:hypothetical protein